MFSIPKVSMKLVAWKEPWKELVLIKTSKPLIGKLVISNRGLPPM